MKGVLTKLQSAKLTLCGMAHGVMPEFPKKEKGVNGIVIEVGLLVVGVALVLIFKDQIGTFIKDLITKVTTKLNSSLT